MHPIGLAPGSQVPSISAGQGPVLWAWLDLNQRPHPYQGSAQRLVSLGLRRWPARTTCHWRPLETVGDRWVPMGCGPNVDQSALLLGVAWTVARLRAAC